MTQSETILVAIAVGATGYLALQRLPLTPLGHNWLAAAITFGLIALLASAIMR